MLGFRSILLSLFTIAVCCNAKWPEEWSPQSPNRKFFARGVDLMDQFTAINQNLEGGVKSESPKANFEFLDMPVINKRERFPWPRKQQLPDPDMDRAVALFKSLQQVNEHEQCNLKSYNILKENYNAANGLPQWGYERVLAKRRVNKIVKEYAEIHAKACSPKYFDLYRANVEKLNPGQKEFAEKLVKNLIYNQHGKEKGKETLGDAGKLLKFAQDNQMTHMVTSNPAFCLSEMRRLTKDDPNSKYVEPQPKEWLGKQILEVNKEELQKLYNKYMLKPCKEYIMKLETVFMPAGFDTHYLVTPAKQDELDYYLNWAAFSLCDLMVLYDTTVPFDIAKYANFMAEAGKPF